MIMADAHDARRSGAPNTVLGITEARIFAVAYTNSEGREAMCLAIQFGKNTNDGKPGVFIMAEEAQMREMRVAGKTVTEGVRKFIARDARSADAVPEELLKDVDGGFDIGELVKGG